MTVVVSGPKANKQALIEQAFRDHPEEAETEGVLFVPEDILGDDEEARTATLLAIHQQGQVTTRIRQAQAETPLGRMRRAAWRQVGL